ncbi:MAG: hypothetical protein HYZ54_06205 [Ignavibacteriae bacterium]|nr:hypothetical protein [Ignavibacteriota bacterium]
MRTLYSHLEHLLAYDERFYAKGKLRRNKLVEYALRSDSELLKYLLSDQIISMLFFKEEDGKLVFDKAQFQEFIDTKSFVGNNPSNENVKIEFIFDTGIRPTPQVA